MHTSVREIHVASQLDSAYFLRVDWSGRDLGSGFRLLLTDGQDAWGGEVSEAAVRGEARDLEMQEERYLRDLRQALTGWEDSAAYGFTLTPCPTGRGAAANAATVTLAYEKVQRDISFQLGSVVLRAVPEPAEAVREILTHSLQRRDTLQHQNQNLEEENQRLRQEQRRITAELKRYAGGKEALEAELYSRFVVVLNEKKAKIRTLQEAVAHLREARSSAGQNREDPVESDRTAGQGEEEDEYGGSTDEEAEEVQQTPASARQNRDSSTPSPLDDSLRDITDVAPSRKRRARHPGAPDPAAKRPTPQASQRKRSDPPSGSSKQQQQQQTPQRSADAAAACSAAAEDDLFQDF